MAIIQGMQVYLETHPNIGGTRDPVYVGVEGAGLSGREFPLRYERNGLDIASGEIYKFEFGIGGPGADFPPAWDALGEGLNGLAAYPIDAYIGSEQVKVYFRKEPINPRGDGDNPLVLVNYYVVLTVEEGDYIWFKARHDSREEESPMYLANEYGNKSYLFPG